MFSLIKWIHTKIILILKVIAEDSYVYYYN